MKESLSVLLLFLTTTTAFTTSTTTTTRHHYGSSSLSLPSLAPRITSTTQCNAESSLSSSSSSSTAQYSDLTDTLRDVYENLENGSPIYKKYSDTIKFSFVAPPTSAGAASTSTGAETSSSSSVSFETIAREYDTTERPIALYLPGLDCFGISGQQQFHDLSQQYELWRMSITTNDRTPFYQLVSTVAQFITDITTNNKSNRKIILIGESFGGLLAPIVALKIRAIEKKQRTKQQQLMQAHTAEAQPADNHDNSNNDSILKGMVLVNPATSFDDTNWDQLGPLLASLQNFSGGEQGVDNPGATPYTVAGGLLLSSLIPDAFQFQSILDKITEVPMNSPLDDIPKAFETMSQGFGTLGKRLPAELVMHRVSNWMVVGSQILTDARLSTLAGSSGDNNNAATAVPTLVVIGEEDKFLPSKNEANRLMKILNNESDDNKNKNKNKEDDKEEKKKKQEKKSKPCQKLVVKGAGHFVLDGRVNLTEAIFYSSIDPFDLRAKAKKSDTYDPILDWTLPNAEALQETIETRVKPLRTLTSPVFFSTDPVTKKRVKGLGKLPKGNLMGTVMGNYDKDTSKSDNNDAQPPILFVSNHQLFGLDLGMIIAQLIEDRGIIARGLAHPVVFTNSEPNGPKLKNEPEQPGIVPQPADPNNNNPQQSNTPADAGYFAKFGAVKVTPRNYYRLLQSKQNVMLFPGGVREVFHGKDEAYQLFWPDEPDFVRTAVRFNATIIPISAVGAADSVTIRMDAPDIVNLPFGIGDNLLAQSKNTISARFNAANEDELFVPPLFTPKIPARNYFCFGAPFTTQHLNHKDTDDVATLYGNVQEELNRGFTDILRSRKKDTYATENIQRLTYERVTGKQAPTFPITEMNE